MSFLIDDILKQDFGKKSEDESSICSSSNKSTLCQNFVRSCSVYSPDRGFEESSFKSCTTAYNRQRSYSTPVYVNPYTNYYEERYWASYAALSMSYQQYKRKGGQIRFTTSQTDVLEKTFLTHKYLTPEQRKILAENLKLSDRQVKTWFQNRRAKWRRSTGSTSTDIQMDKDEESHEDVFVD
ncbi:unnamed protein product [Brassicogethes aeneus]|uniref:Homeobox domain-containing protein n=1 Tax=Brassicogethes aeneus TaxID=1431903 RepID=A0A9P0B232_BRAAE|nr:unnamed protein product [Brassicogethes aeneus]